MFTSLFAAAVLSAPTADLKTTYASDTSYRIVRETTVDMELTDMQIGGVTPFGLPADMPLWIDSRVMERDRILLGGGSRSCKVVGLPTMLTALPNSEVVVDLAKEVPTL